VDGEGDGPAGMVGVGARVDDGLGIGATAAVENPIELLSGSVENPDPRWHVSSSSWA